MSLSDELALSYYKPVADINADRTVKLVQHTQTGKFYVSKHIAIYNPDVYRSLMADPVPDTPVIYELAEDDSGLTLIEEYLPGDTLQEILDRDGVFTEDEVIGLLLQLCRIISALHHREPPIIHRDIKPSNIIISPDNVLKLLDFNTAKYEDPDESRDTRLLGTAGYAAPEQYGFGASAVQTDLYSMGVLMNVLLCGAVPSEKLADGSLSAIIKKCTELNPSDRFSDVDELEKALNDLRGDKTPKTKAGSHPSWTRFLPPGFRTGNALHMMLAVPGYLIIFYLGLTLNIDSDSRLDLTLNRIAVILILLLIVFFSADYLDIQERLPLTGSKKWPVLLTGIILYDILLSLTVLIMLVFAENLML